MYQTLCNSGSRRYFSGRIRHQAGRRPQPQQRVVVVGQDDVAVLEIDVARHVDERRLRRRTTLSASPIERPSRTIILRKQIRRARLIALQDRFGHQVGRGDGHGYFSAVRMAAAPPFTLMRPPVSFSVVPSHEKTQ